jgi:hypothetical protein
LGFETGPSGKSVRLDVEALAGHLTAWWMARRYFGGEDGVSD